ncbi:PIG-L family deacetylase [Candidatus Puniceispirillum sp.]|nr:PIG-L family deacetylase [Candidatus Puniceispirillum sp.]
MNIVAIGAHPDDLEIFAYGFLAAATARGDHLYLGVATDGAAGGVSPGPKLARQRAKETVAGLALLGTPTLLDLPDGDLVNAPKAREKITDFIRSSSPDLVITHAPEDYHPDHRALSSFVVDAAGFICPVLFCDTLMGVGFNPDYYVDISLHFDDKKNAIMAHHSQEPARFVSASNIMNRFRAAQCNAPEDHFAEAYRVDSRFPFADIRDLLPPPPPYRPFYVPGSNALI